MELVLGGVLHDQVALSDIDASCEGMDACVANDKNGTQSFEWFHLHLTVCVYVYIGSLQSVLSHARFVHPSRKHKSDRLQSEILDHDLVVRNRLRMG